MKRLGIVLAAWLLAGGAARAGEADVFRNDTAGFQVTRPAGWQYASAQQNLDNLKGIRLSDSELQAALQKAATAPLVVMTKFAEPYEDVNPSFKVTLKPYGPLKGATPLQLLGLIIPQFRSAFRDAKLVQEPVEVDVGGVRSAYARLDYTLETQDGRRLPTASELWIVPRGDYFFMLGAGTRQDEKNAKRSELAAILKSVKVIPQSAPPETLP